MAEESKSGAAAAEAFPAIGDYAVIGNCRTAALVSREGGVEWMCLPDFASDPLFAAALDRRAGHFSVRPAGRYRAERAYVPGTNVLQTTFHCEGGGVVQLTDCMPLPYEPPGDMQTSVELEPEHELLRKVECTQGEVELELSFAPRLGFGRSDVHFRRLGKLGWQCTRCPFGAIVHSDFELQPSRQGELGGRARLRAGETRWLSLAYDESEISIIAPLGPAAQQRVDDTVNWWQGWARSCTYEGDYRDEVVRSALALKLLHCATSGAVIAAPTTSLPEAIGGTRNWDYRYCWLRDSALTLHAFFRLGFIGEGDSFLAWLLHATRLTFPRLQVLYDQYGETNLKEKTLDWLTGYRGSRPVRVGNGAHKQLQLDIYGELIAAVALFVDAGGELDQVEKGMLAGLSRSVCELWRLPDHGIWETRREPRHHTFSKAMCWVALDRLRAMNGRIGLGLDDQALERECSELRAQIESQGYNERLGAYVGYYGGEEPDASLLLLARHRYRAPEDARMSGTYRFIQERLSSHGLIRRFPTSTSYDGVAGGENAFAACSFWAAEYLANAGRRREAKELFDRLLHCANDVGLYAEEIEPETGAPRGNIPQGFSHISMISAAVALEVEPTA